MQQVEARSIRADMVAESAESWARLRLVQGESDTRALELLGQEEQTILSVGTNEDGSWVIREQGVRPLNFSLHWDGTSLRIADTHNAGNVRVDGQVIGAQWVLLTGQSRIEFGSAEVVAETSQASEAPQASGQVVDPGPAEAPTTSVRQTKDTLVGVPSLVASVVQESKRQEPDSAVAKKMTLLGVAAPGPRPVVTPQPSGSEAPPPSKRVAKETLIGVAIPGTGAHAVLSQEQAAQVTQTSPEPGGHSATPGSARPTLRAGSSAPPGRPDADVPQARLMGHDVTQPAFSREQTQEDFAGARTSAGDVGATQARERYSDAPTEMRDPALQSRPPPSAFPWRFLGIGALTVAAYFAWLYLLDHL